MGLWAALTSISQTNHSGYIINKSINVSSTQISCTLPRNHELACKMPKRPVFFKYLSLARLWRIVIDLTLPGKDTTGKAGIGPWGLVSWRPTTVKWRQSSKSNRHSTIGTRKTEYHEGHRRRRTTRWGVTARSPTIVTLHDTRFGECRWSNDAWTVKSVVTWRSSASVIPAPGLLLST